MSDIYLKASSTSTSTAFKRVTGSTFDNKHAVDIHDINSRTDIALGNCTGWTAKLIQGFYLSVTTTLTDIVSFGGVVSLPTSAESLEIISSSANDAAAGTGARTVLVTGLNASWEVQSETVTLNGTSAVTLTLKYIRVNDVIVSSTGTYSGSNLGTITLRVAGGGSTRSEIPYDATFGGYGRSQSTIYTVPANKKALITQIRFDVESTKPVNIYGIIKTNADDVTASYSGYRHVPLFFTHVEDFINLPVDMPFLVEAKSDIRFQAYANGATTGNVSISYQIIQIDV